MKNTPYALFETSKELESGAGVRVNYPGFSININRAGGSNEKYATILEEKMKPHLAEFQRGALDDAITKKILIESFVAGILVSWDGVKDRKGKALPFTPANAYKLLTDLPELLADLRRKANDFANFREQQQQADEKN